MERSITLDSDDVPGEAAAFLTVMFALSGVLWYCVFVTIPLHPVIAGLAGLIAVWATLYFGFRYT